MISGIVAAQGRYKALAALWTPMNMSTPPKILLDWASTVSAVSGFAQTWGDRSGNGWDFTALGSTARPEIRTDVLGVRTLRFDGVNDGMQNTSDAVRDMMRATSAGWVLAVTRTTGPNSSAGAQLVLSVTGSSANTDRFTVFSNTGANYRIQAGTLGRLDADSATFLLGSKEKEYGDWAMRMFARNYAAGTAALLIDGDTDNSTSGLSVGSTSGTRSAAVSVGARGSGGAGFCGDLACVVVGAGSLPSPDEIDKLFGWAAWACGLQDNLPVGHPYKDEPPRVE